MDILPGEATLPIFLPAFSKGVRERGGGNLGKEFASSGVHPFLEELRLPQKQIVVSYEKKMVEMYTHTS